MFLEDEENFEEFFNNLSDSDIDIPDSDEDFSENEDEQNELKNDEKKETEEQASSEEESSNDINKDSNMPNDLLSLLKDEIVYNGEKVKFNSKAEVIDAIEKGLNYDKLKSKLNSYKDSEDVLQFFNEKAEKLGISVSDYLSKVKQYENDQIEKQIQESYQKMLDDGISEDTAKRVIEYERNSRNLEKRQEDITQKENLIHENEKKEKEYSEFIQAYPNVEASSIPKEVWEKMSAQNLSLLNAYKIYENEQLKEKIKILEQNNKNKSTSVVSTTNDGGSTHQEDTDLFVQGFDEDEF